MEDERRQNIRHIIKSKNIRCKMLPDIEGRLLNICLRGACVSLNQRLTLGNEHELHLDSGKSSINLKGIVIWEKVETSPRGGQDEAPAYEAGLKFIDIGDKEKSTLDQFIDSIIRI